MTNVTQVRDAAGLVDSRKAWTQLAIAVLLGTIGGVGVWSVVVVLPAVQATFGVARADAALPYTLAMLGFAIGGIAMGRLADRFGIRVPLLIGTAALTGGYIAAAFVDTMWQFALVHGALIGLFGTAATFGPLMAEVSHWFRGHRGIAVAVSASGNYLAGTIWPPVVQHFVDTVGWRQTHLGIGLFCAATMLPLALLLRRRPAVDPASARATDGARPRALGLSPGRLQALLCVAGVACCTAMAMPQVHIVAYCGDLGYGVARGADMLSLMLGFGIVSRVGSGWMADRLGGLMTLLIGSALQGLALALYFMFDGLGSLYIISALFGLFQGGIVPSYAVVVREYFPAGEAGTRVGITLMATLVGMAFGGWMSGVIFDWTGSYRAAFANGMAWNVLHIAIVTILLMRRGPRVVLA